MGSGADRPRFKAQLSHVDGTLTAVLLFRIFKMACEDLKKQSVQTLVIFKIVDNRSQGH